MDLHLAQVKNTQEGGPGLVRKPDDDDGDDEV